MKVKRVKRRKLKIKNLAIFFITFLVIIILAVFIYIKFIDIKIKNIYIIGNKYVSDIEIIREAKLENYPKIMSISESKIRKELIKSNGIINDVKVKKGLFGKIVIEVEEAKPLFYNKTTNDVILDNKKEIDYINIDNLPILDKDSISDDKIYDKLIKKYSEINDEIIDRISEIKYDPNSVDDERFLIMMNDGNYVYITLVKIEEINYYVKILPTLDDKKGVLNLDYGNNFEIIE